MKSGQPTSRLRLRLVGNVITLNWDGVDIWEHICLSPEQAEMTLAITRVAFHPADSKRGKRRGKEGVTVEQGPRKKPSMWAWIDKASHTFPGSTIVQRNTQTAPIQ